MRFSCKAIPAILLFLSIVFSNHSAYSESLPNGGFEQGDGAVPDSWQFGCSSGCNGSLSFDTETKVEGARSIRMSSETPFGPNIYCGLAQTLQELEPGQTYRISFQAKGENVGVCWFGGGAGWRQRKMLPEGSFDWQTFRMEWVCGPGQTTFDFRVNLDAATVALWIDDVRLTTMTPDDPVIKETLSKISVQEERAKGLQAELANAAAEGLAVQYPRADIAIAARFCQYARDDVAHVRFERAQEVADEVEQILDRAAREMKDNVAVPVLKKDAPIEIRDGSFWADCVTQHGEEKRPIFLTGYGHFDPVVQDLPLFSEIGINIMQIEIGPCSTVFEDGIHTEEVKSRICSALDRAQANGVRVCVLLSPHYFPQWAFEKWPSLAVGPSGFMNNSLDAPEARDIYRQHVQALIPLIKDHPALHSVCLSNEPVSTGFYKDPCRIKLWHAYLERKHRTIEALNAVYGTSYASFDEVPHPALSFNEKRAPLYDAVRFNQEAFAEWHAWMASTIHEIAPGLPCHAKVMLLPGDRGTVLWGTDPWDFAKLSQVNGNDCAYMRFIAGHEWVCGWWGQNMYYDLERAMKRVPIFNTENHIIQDREASYIPPVHIYAAIWQGAVHGQGASTTWAWQRTYDLNQDFEGLILHRAACTAAMSRCSLDLMRLSKEVAALQNQQPSVAILYSNAATIADSRHVDAREAVYYALNFSGVPVGFITDEQVAAGLLDQYQCLFVAGARASTADAVEAMRKWAALGGHIVEYGSGNLVEDEYARMLTPPPFTKTLEARKEEDKALTRDEVMEFLKENGIGPEIVIHAEDGAVPYGVEWRTAKCDGRTVVNMINYKPVTAKVCLPGDNWKNLMTNQNAGAVVALEPETPLLLSQE